MSTLGNDPLTEFAQTLSQDSQTSSAISQPIFPMANDSVISHAELVSNRPEMPSNPKTTDGMSLNLPLQLRVRGDGNVVQNEDPFELDGIDNLDESSHPLGALCARPPSQPPLSNPNVSQQKAPGFQYSPRSRSRRVVEIEAADSDRNFHPWKDVESHDEVEMRILTYRPRRTIIYGDTLPPAYRFKLLKEKLAGLIMGCTDETKEECLRDLVFGLPAKHWDYIENVATGTMVYLFNYSRRCLYGIFKAVGSGVYALKPYGWSHDKRIPTPYPAQIQVEQVDQCPCLYEDEFGPVLDAKMNYITLQKFSFELDKEQVCQLNQIFVSTQAANPNRPEPPIRIKDKTRAPPHLQTPYPSTPMHPSHGRGRSSGRRWHGRGGGGGGRNRGTSRAGPSSSSVSEFPTNEVAHPGASIDIGSSSSAAVVSRSINRSSVATPPPGMGPPGILSSNR